MLNAGGKFESGADLNIAPMNNSGGLKRTETGNSNNRLMASNSFGGTSIFALQDKPSKNLGNTGLESFTVDKQARNNYAMVSPNNILDNDPSKYMIFTPGSFKQSMGINSFVQHPTDKHLPNFGGQR